MKSAAQVLWIRAKHAPRCCSQCGKLAALVQEPRTRAQVLALGIAKGLAVRAVLEKRFDDMCASGLLVRTHGDE